MFFFFLLVILILQIHITKILLQHDGCKRWSESQDSQTATKPNRTLKSQSIGLNYMSPFFPLSSVKRVPRLPTLSILTFLVAFRAFLFRFFYLVLFVKNMVCLMICYFNVFFFFFPSITSSLPAIILLLAFCSHPGIHPLLYNHCCVMSRNFLAH